MHWSAVLVLALLVGFILYETAGTQIYEGFTSPMRSDIGLSSDGWREESGYVRDLRYSEAFVDIQGIGVATDFCRAVSRKEDPDSLHIACALGRRDGMDTLEYKSKTTREGFRFSRDDYWRPGANGRMDYCRIVRDEEDGMGTWYATCAVAGRYGFKPQEERDTNPPPAIRQLLEAYDGIMTWFRWQDDAVDYAGAAGLELHGRPEFPTILKPVVTRGLQLNRNLEIPLNDYLRWGEHGTLHLDQNIMPRQIRAISFWVWWDKFEKGARIIEASTGGKKNLMWLGIEGAGPSLPGLQESAVATPAQETRPAALLAVGQLTEPARTTRSPPATPTTPTETTSTYVFEIWDEEQRLVRLAGPQGLARMNQWQHVAVTTTNIDSWWTTWQLWIDGALVATKTDSRLSPAIQLTQNFIGRNVRGCLQDLRIYNKPLYEEKLQAAIAWSKPKLHPNP
jgi:hypothetical protein